MRMMVMMWALVGANFTAPYHTTAGLAYVLNYWWHLIFTTHFSGSEAVALLWCPVCVCVCVC